MMNRRSLLIASATAAAVGCLAFPAAAAPIPLSDLSAYLNNLTTAETEFSQVNADGSRSSGRVLIHRPNRMRFEYAPPNAALVLASAGQVAIFDPKSNQPPEQYPLRRTPLNLILARNVDLNRARMVVAHREEGAHTVVVAQDPDNPQYGTIALYFARGPLRLEKWIVTDDSGARTTVQLGPLRTGQRYGASTFSIDAERSRRGN